ncbi:hypothetical protein CBS101457_001255 [Exobasidium rhododendri]|nr:hypothetical protein CBS101457_001255 [Exobasidium rhododendri]
MMSSHAKSDRSAGPRNIISSAAASRRQERRPTSTDLGSSTTTQYSNVSMNRSPSVASSASTYATSASKFSLSTSFVNLNAHDIDFFDQIVDLLPPGADDFASLKRAYNKLRGESEYYINETQDAFLWDTLLKLIQVRGKDWAKRWDAVRMAIGLEPRVSSGSERERDNGVDGQGEEEVEEEETSESDTVKEQGGGRDSSSPAMQESRPSTTRAEIEALRRRMALLTTEAGNLVGTIQRRTEPEVSHAVQRSFVTRNEERRSAKSRNVKGSARQLRFAEQEIVKRDEKATKVESASDEENARTQRVPLRPYKFPSVDDLRPVAAQRQFDEVVARSRNEREAQKRAQEDQQEAIEEARLFPLLKKADQLSSYHLKCKCFLWWKTSSLQRNKKVEEARQARDVVIAGKVLKAWRSSTTKRQSRLRGAAKVDDVRCKLRAWRVWRRTLQEASTQRREEKRSRLKGAYTLTRRIVEQRIVKEGFLHWKLVLMTHRTTHFRTQHLVRGAFSLWKLHMWRSITLSAKEVVVKGKIEDELISRAWEKWTEACRMNNMNRLAEAFHRHRLLQKFFLDWTITREEKATLRRREALADRWRARRTKRSALLSWQHSLAGVRRKEHKANDLQARQVDVLLTSTLKIWRARRREVLFQKVDVFRVMSTAFTKWTKRYDQLTLRLTKLEDTLTSRIEGKTLGVAFHMWRETTEQIVMSQRLAGERDRRKIKTETFIRWMKAVQGKRGDMQHATVIDGFLLQRKMWSLWMARHTEVKVELLRRSRNRALMGTTMTFWKARFTERRQEKLKIDAIQKTIEGRIRRESLSKWTAAVIERKSVLMEAREKRDAYIVRSVWLKWIDACLRHEDMLNLSKSFIDVKKEEQLRRTFLAWVKFARAESNRKLLAKQFLREKRTITLEKSVTQWYDRYVESSLRPLEYEALLQRQKIVQRLIFTRWKSRTTSLPAIRFDHVRSKSHTFYRWLERLPLVRVENQATRWDKQSMQRKGFQHWSAAARAKKAVRAAARFGGPSAARLRSTAYLYQRGMSNPYGGFGSSSPSPVPTKQSRHKVTQNVTPTMLKRMPLSLSNSEKGQESLRESDLVMIDGGGGGGGGSSRNSNNRERRVPLELDRHNDAAAPTPALQRWMQTLHQSARKEVNAEEAEASSEPPSSFLNQKRAQRREQINRTPSPTASQVQSEVTMRIRSSPRKSKKPLKAALDTNTIQRSLDVRLHFKRQRRRSMIFDEAGMSDG